MDDSSFVAFDFENHIIPLVKCWRGFLRNMPLQENLKNKQRKSNKVSLEEVIKCPLLAEFPS